MNKKFFIFIFLLFSAAQTVSMSTPSSLVIIPHSSFGSTSSSHTFSSKCKQKYSESEFQRQTQTVSNESQPFPFMSASIAMTIFTGITYVDDMKVATFICGCTAIATIITGIYQTKKKRENGITNHL